MFLYWTKHLQDIFLYGDFTLLLLYSLIIKILRKVYNFLCCTQLGENIYILTKRPMNSTHGDLRVLSVAGPGVVIWSSGRGPRAGGPRIRVRPWLRITYAVLAGVVIGIKGHGRTSFVGWGGGGSTLPPTPLLWGLLGCRGGLTLLRSPCSLMWVLCLFPVLGSLVSDSLEKVSLFCSHSLSSIHVAGGLRHLYTIHNGRRVYLRYP